MVTYVKCRCCGNVIELPFKTRFNVPFFFKVKCKVCNYEDVYTPSDVWEENVMYMSCPICGMLIALTPGVNECKYCNSKLKLENGKVEVLEKGESPIVKLFKTIITFKIMNINT